MLNANQLDVGLTRYSLNGVSINLLLIALSLIDQIPIIWVYEQNSMEISKHKNIVLLYLLQIGNCAYMCLYNML